MFRFPHTLKHPATVAIFDCGTNSLLLLVARQLPNGRVIPLYQAIASPRLGEGLAGTGKLKPEAVARTLRELKKLKKQALRFRPDCLLVLGTNIFRRAREGKTIARYFERESDLPFLILPASEEAGLEFLGATSGLQTNSNFVAVDVGGGSSEIIWGKGKKVEKKVSLETGAVRLKEQFAGMKNYDEAGLQKLKVEAVRKLSGLASEKNGRYAVLTGGTATSLAAFSLRLKKYEGKKVHGLKTTPEKLFNLVEKLARLSLSGRRRALPFDPARADIIVPGGVILLEILKRLGVKKAIVSDRGLRWGSALAYFS